MPAANIQRSIDRVKDKDAAQLQELVYEGYGPGGVAIIVEAATDNINRTYPEVRLAFTSMAAIWPKRARWHFSLITRA